MSAHTPGPWSCGYVLADHEWLISPPTGAPIASVPQASGAANAAFIVRACNSHDDLIQALERLCNFATELCEDIHVSKHQPSIENAVMVLAIAQGKAIAKARGEA